MLDVDAVQLLKRFIALVPKCAISKKLCQISEGRLFCGSGHQRQGQRQVKKQIPCGNDNKKGDGKDKDKTRASLLSQCIYRVLRGQTLVEEGGSGVGADLGEGWNGFGFRLPCREAL